MVNGKMFYGTYTIKDSLNYEVFQFSALVIHPLNKIIRTIVSFWHTMELKMHLIVRGFVIGLTLQLRIRSNLEERRFLDA